MKRLLIALCVAILFMSLPVKAGAQVTELMQLALNIEKLAQFKQILSDLKKGYEIISGGYKTIKNISEGNFKLHQVFLDGLMEVSPAVKNYRRVGDIINYQLSIVKEYKSSFNRFKTNGWFTADELDYISSVYGNLINLSLKNLDDLLVIITSSKLRMSDDERLAAIDKLYTDMQDKLLFLRSFNSNTSLLSLQRQRESRDINRVQQYYDLKK
ncbi:MAG: TerB family tellurite resistance protein [Agriterribacter sp.]